MEHGTIKLLFPSPLRQPSGRASGLLWATIGTLAEEPDRWTSLQRVYNQHPVVPRHALVRFAECRPEVVADHTAETGDHGNVLLAVGGVADDATLVAKTITVAPQLSAGFRVVGMQRPSAVRHEY